MASSPHHLHPYRENYRSDCFLGLLHDKFGPGFRAQAERAAAEGNYWRDSLEYRATLAALARDPGLALAYPGSRRYRGAGRPRRRRADRADPLGRPPRPHRPGRRLAPPPRGGERLA